LHQAIQYHFEQLLSGQPPPDLDTLLGVFQDHWQTYEPQTIQYAKTENRDTLGRLADRMLRTFLRSDFARPKGTILGIEEELRAAIIPGCPDLLARVDSLIERKDALHVLDFKTARSAWNADKVEEAAPQLLLYSELAHMKSTMAWGVQVSRRLTRNWQPEKWKASGSGTSIGKVRRQRHPRSAGKG
jgi:hypothetical protein